MLATLLTGCAKSGVEVTAPEAEGSAATAAGQPQRKLPTIKLWLGAKEIVAEQAVTAPQVETGMMFRKDIGEMEGMLFIFQQPQRASFWMRHTLIPLSLAYIDPAGSILEIHHLKPLDETPVQAASDQVQFVLEMKEGWFERNQVGVGTAVRTDRGSLSQTYFGTP
ncbi:MAG: DUF192 domain-containing protein [Verrucomicrobiota bacterium]